MASNTLITRNYTNQLHSIKINFSPRRREFERETVANIQCVAGSINYGSSWRNWTLKFKTRYKFTFGRRAMLHLDTGQGFHKHSNARISRRILQRRTFFIFSCSLAIFVHSFTTRGKHLEIFKHLHENNLDMKLWNITKYHISTTKFSKGPRFYSATVSVCQTRPWIVNICWEVQSEACFHILCPAV